MPEELESDYIVLRKQPYGERGLIVNGISPEYGRVDFIVGGANGGMRRAFPELELFRLLHLTFVVGKGELCRIKTASLLESFDGLATDYGRYEAAVWISSFTLLNTMQMLPNPLYCNAVEVGLRRLAGKEFGTDCILTGVCMAFLFESGWLTHALQDSQSQNQCRIILEMASGKEAPLLSDESWRQQLDWCRSMLMYNECRMP